MAVSEPSIGAAQATCRQTPLVCFQFKMSHFVCKARPALSNTVMGLWLELMIMGLYAIYKYIGGYNQSSQLTVCVLFLEGLETNQ